MTSVSLVRLPLKLFMHDLGESYPFATGFIIILKTCLIGASQEE